jgi:SAM-dependent methyltransferase
VTTVTSKAAAAQYRLNTSRYGSHMRLLEALPMEGRGRRILDVGCSGGYFASLLAERGFEVTGIERADGHGGDIPRNVRLVEHDLEQGLPPLDGRFAFIICADVLEHLRDPGALLRGLNGILEPDGRIVASLPNSGNLYFRLVVLSGRFPKHDRGLFDRTHVQFMMWNDWAGLFEGAGYRIESVRSTPLPFSLAWPALRPFTEAVEWMWIGFAKLWKRLFAYQFVITVVRNSEVT